MTLRDFTNENNAGSNIVSLPEITIVKQDIEYGEPGSQSGSQSDGQGMGVTEEAQAHSRAALNQTCNAKLTA